MTKLRCAVVGTGGWAETHLRAYQRCAHVEPVALVGHANADRLAALAQRYGIPHQGLDLAQVVAATDAEMVDLACNPHYRLEGVRAALAPSVRLINLEKPMALTPGDAYEIERLCRTEGKLLTVNHQKKYLPAWRQVQALIEAGELGELRYLRATCQGNLLEQGTHLVDMALFYNGYRPIEWVLGQIDGLEGLDKPGASAPDAALAEIAFADGVRATLTIGTVGHHVPGETNKWHHFAIEAYGSAGHAVVTLNRYLEVVRYADGRTTRAASSWDQGYVQAVADHLDDAALYAQDPARGHISSLERSLASFQAVMAIYASGCGDGIVRLPRRFDDGLLDRLAQRRAAQG
ncbi:MAG: Gfo/Idh/MocA family oxidoreductase [Chloroflexota bacterium]